MMDRVLNLLFGCRRHRLTRPITPVRRNDATPGDTYVVCLECGRQFYYDTVTMRVGTPIGPPLTTHLRESGSFQSQF
jgi:hypothetical protein